MISDEEIRRIYEQAAISYFEEHRPDIDLDDMSGLAGLRAVETAARADQAEIDAQIAVRSNWNKHGIAEEIRVPFGVAPSI